ncbi:MAG: non-ribosomal peptide synthetase [Gammaproteobacteria bacterium]|nr:non-ribosomal peptide synthetase [Gammaproteobacteria bacterium]
MQFKTLVDALTLNRSEDRFVGFINGQDEEKIITFNALYERALGLLHVLQQKGMRQGDYLLLNLNDNEKMVDVFWACQLGGIIPVPLAIGISDQHRQKIFNVYKQLTYKKLNSAYLYTDRKTLLKLQTSAADSLEISAYESLAEHVLLTDDVVDVSEPGQIVDVAPEDVSFVQFSSGSTGSPKGVVLKHRNLLANIDGIQRSAEFTTNDTSLSWMPLTHDMGLIGFHLNPIVCNYNHYIMRTDLFIRRPLYWMTAASDKKANVLCSPNFGYKHFLNAYSRKGLGNIDLSHMRLIFNGAEPISVNLCEQFTNEMTQFGLPKNSMYPVYGLAEASLAVSFPSVGAELSVVNLQRESLAIGAKAEIKSQSEKTSTLVGVGMPIPHCKVRISNKEGEELSEGTVGHIHIGGENVTEEIIGDDGSIFFAGGWVNTGDLGFISNLGLFITGRYKEILFVNGQNYYPYDIEETLQKVEGLEHELELGKVVITGVSSDKNDLEQVIVFILHKGKLNEFQKISAKVKTKINEQYGIEVHQVLPIRKVPKTTSGKVQRSVLADMYIDGEFDEVLKELAPVKDICAQKEESSSDEIVNAIKKICKEALPDKSFSINDSLLELGASSLSLVEIHSGLDELYPGKIEITDLVDHPTIADLAEYLKSKESLLV